VIATRRAAVAAAGANGIALANSNQNSTTVAAIAPGTRQQKPLTRRPAALDVTFAALSICAFVIFIFISRRDLARVRLQENSAGDDSDDESFDDDQIISIVPHWPRPSSLRGSNRQEDFSRLRLSWTPEKPRFSGFRRGDVANDDRADRAEQRDGKRGESEKSAQFSQKGRCKRQDAHDDCREQEQSAWPAVQ
jgi:hypothetical protein